MIWWACVTVQTFGQCGGILLTSPIITYTLHHHPSSSSLSSLPTIIVQEYRNISTASILRSIKILSTIYKAPCILTMDTYIRNNFMGLLRWLDVGIYLWLRMLRQPLGIFLLNLISNLVPQAVFNFGRSLEKQVCKCGQPIEYLHYYIVERHNAAVLLPWEWDTNKELTSRPVVSLRSNTAIKTVRSDLAKPFCCRPPLEQAGILFKLTEPTLKRHDIPCFIMPVEKDPSDSHEYSVARWGSL